MDKKHQDFYRRIRKDISKWLEKNSSNKWAEYILLAPDLFYLLTKLVMDDSVPVKKKAVLGAAIAYFISPIDLLPEAFLGPFGFLDDIAVAAYVLNDLLNELDPQIVLKHWAGEHDLLYSIKNIIINSQQMLGADIVKKIANKFKL